MNWSFDHKTTSKCFFRAKNQLKMIIQYKNQFEKPFIFSRLSLIYFKRFFVCVIVSNQIWGTNEAIEWMKNLIDFKPWWIEEPTSPDDVIVVCSPWIRLLFSFVCMCQIFKFTAPLFSNNFPINHNNLRKRKKKKEDTMKFYFFFLALFSFKFFSFESFNLSQIHIFINEYIYANYHIPTSLK